MRRNGRVIRRVGVVGFVVGGALIVVGSNHCVVCYVNLTCEFIVALISIDFIHNLFFIILDEQNKFVQTNNILKPVKIK